MTTVQSESADGFVLALSRQFAVYRMFLWLVEGPITGRYWSIVYRRGVWNCYHIVTDLQSLKHCASLSARSIQKERGLGPVFIKIPLMLFPCVYYSLYIKKYQTDIQLVQTTSRTYIYLYNPSTTSAKSWYQLDDVSCLTSIYGLGNLKYSQFSSECESDYCIEHFIFMLILVGF